MKCLKRIVCTALFGFFLAPVVFASQFTLPMSEEWKGILDYQLGGFSVEELVLCLLVVILTLIFRAAIVRSAFKFLKRSTKKRGKVYGNEILQKLEKPLSAFILVTGLFLAVQFLSLEASTASFIDSLFRALTMLFVAWSLMRITDVSMSAYEQKLRADDATISSFMPQIRKAIRIFIVLVGALMVIDNLGYSVSGILATLGIGGAALAFASKDTVANFFGSLCIALDRPFTVGDWIQVGDKLNGDVLSIGFRSTRIKTFFATELSIPNSVLANETIVNWSRMPKRRVKQVIGVSYDTDPDVVNDIVEDFRKLLREDEGVNQDFILVNFTDFAESSLEILVYYFTKTTNWLEYLDVRQRMNIKMMKAIEARGSSIAFPSRTLYFANTEGGNSKSNPLLGDDIQEM